MLRQPELGGLHTMQNQGFRGSSQKASKVRKLPKYLTLHEMLEQRVPAKIGVLQVMKFSGKRSATWQNQLLVLHGNTLGIFPTDLANNQQVLPRVMQNKGAWRKIRSEMHFDLSEPTLSVSVSLSASVRRRPGEFAQAEDLQNQGYEWTLSVQRYRGLFLVRLRCATLDERDQWVSALRSFDLRTSTIAFTNGQPSGNMITADPSKSNRVMIHPKFENATEHTERAAEPFSPSITTTAIPNSNEGKSKSSKKRPSFLRMLSFGSNSTNSKRLDGRSPKSQSPGHHQHKVHSEKFSPSTLKNSATFSSRESGSSLVRAMHHRLTSNDFIVHRGHEDITTRRQELVKVFAEHLEKTEKQHHLPIHPSFAEEILRDSEWNLEAAIHAVACSNKKIEDCGSGARARKISLTDTNEEKEEISYADSRLESFQTATCKICFETINSPEMASMLRCGHAFCKDCWSGYISCRIKEGKECLSTTCMEPKCNEKASPAFIREHAETPELCGRFDRFYTDAFVDTCTSVRWCPRQGCGNAVEWKLSETADLPRKPSSQKCHHRSVQCLCGFEFCFDCGNAAHAPATCEQVEAWHRALLEAEEAGDVQAAPRQEQEQVMAKKWILNHARPCPKCKVPIEKMQGCNHMKCTSCQYEFCWACLGSWAEHGAETGGFFRCKITEEKPDEIAERQRAARVEVQNEFSASRAKALEERKKHAEQEEAFRKAKDLRRRVAHVLRQYIQYSDNAEWTNHLHEDLNHVLENSLLLAPQRRLVKFLQYIMRVICECQGLLKWGTIVGFFLNAPSTSSEWIYLAGSEPNFERNHRFFIDGPHRALYLARLGALAQVAERLQETIETPAIALELFDVGHVQNSSISNSPSRRKNVKAWRFSKDRRNRTVQALHFARAIIPIEQDLASLCCQTLERMQEVSRLARELNSMLHQLANPISGFNNVPSLLQSADVRITPVSADQQWVCSLCGWQNTSGSACQACSNTVIRNFFTRYRHGLFQQVRRCIGCSAELSLSEKYESPCRCAASSLSCAGPAACFNKYTRHFAKPPSQEKDVVGRIDLVCPECERKVLEGRYPEAASPEDLEEAALLEVLEGRDSEEKDTFSENRASPLDDVEEVHENSIIMEEGSNKETHRNFEGVFQCPSGHDLIFDKDLSCGSFECDFCCRHTRGSVGFCQTCNVVMCKPCGHLQTYSEKEEHAVFPPLRRRRNALFYGSRQALQAQTSRDIQPRRRTQSYDPSVTLPRRESEQPAGWECSRCTFWNPQITTHRCRMCHNQRAASPTNGDVGHIQPNDQHQEDGEGQTSPAQSLRNYRSNHTVSMPLRRPRLVAFDGNESSTDDSNADRNNESDNESMISLSSPREGDAGVLAAFEETILRRASLDEAEANEIRRQRENSRRAQSVSAESSETTSALVDPISLFSPRTHEEIQRSRLAATLAPTLTSPLPFISMCKPDDALGLRCLTLIKPVRHDPRRVQTVPMLLNRPSSMELWWESRCSGAPSFVCIRVSLVLMQRGKVVYKSFQEMEDTGVCHVHLPALARLSLQNYNNEQPLLLSIRLEACEASPLPQTAPHPVLSVSTPPFLVTASTSSGSFR